MVVFDFLRKIKRTIIWLIAVLRNVFCLGSISNAPCYFSDRERKGCLLRYFDNVKWLLLHGEKNLFYTQYGLDIKGSSMNDYIGFSQFMNIRNKFNQLHRLDNSIGILRDKFLFYKYMKVNKLAVPEVFAVERDGVVFDTFFSKYEVNELRKECDYFVKDVSGECASFVKHIKNYDHLKSFSSQMNSGSFLFQRKIIQHPEMERLNPNAVNTIRIVSVNDCGKIKLFASILRVGTKISGCADNTSAGGIALGIEDDGKLFKFGLLKPKYGTRCEKHPDTGVVFEDFKIPYYEDAVKLVCHAHKFYSNVKSIGWDVAITESGPVIIEGNDNWEITSIQAIYGGKKKFLQNLMKSC